MADASGEDRARAALVTAHPPSGAAGWLLERSAPTLAQPGRHDACWCCPPGDVFGLGALLRERTLGQAPAFDAVFLLAPESAHEAIRAAVLRAPLVRARYALIERRARAV